MGQFLDYALPGIPYGCTFAIVAVGLVLTYQATGVFNFAFGAQAFASAFVYTLLVGEGIGTWPAFVIAVVVLAPVLGLAFDRLLFRHIAPGNVTAKVVSSIGIFVAVPELISLIFGSSTRFGPPSLFLHQGTVYFHVLSTPVNGLELATVVATFAVVVALVGATRTTALGLQMRAAVESRRLLELDGVNAGRVVSVAWVVSSVMAGLAGVLLAPQYPTLQANDYAVLLVAAVAAACLGGLRSIPLALAGGLALGVGEGLISGYTPSSSILHTGLLPALPFLLLVVVLVTMPSLRHLDDTRDPLAGVDPPPPPLVAATRSARMSRIAGPSRWVLLGVAVVSAMTWVPGNWVFTLATGVALSMIFLSFTVVTGLGGQLSLCQATFAGVGAFTAGQLAAHAGVPVLLGALIGAGLAAVVGAVAALPALRLRGLPLALLTLALALLADNVVFPATWAGGGAVGISVPRPRIGPISFATESTRPFLLLALVALAVCAVVVNLLKKGTVGHFLAAIRGSEVGAASIGINLSWTKVLAFSIAAGLAGLGGAVYGSLQQSVQGVDFGYQFSLVFVVVVVTTGVSTVEGALQAGMGFAVVQQVLSYLPGRVGSGSLTAVLFAMGALTYAAHPEGIVEYHKRRWTQRIETLVFAGHDGTGSTRPPGPAAPRPREEVGADG